ncbi:EAL and modified HD-GYP domain-containing signal transduction protein [Catenuloplanes niger]|uniref:EAL and modified HD-GYP domain-containing signal transduction protein n=2 Tax=Micromonosporaceae TaxID=28056 RepID=A0AAE3ZKB2_9ACTN|nr:EAL and modified HD-GYP domain-containing signal transduction protein [Catenuloplanes niger]
MNPMPSITQRVHVGRQPIFDSRGTVVAYELLFRGSMEAVHAAARDAYATSQVILNVFTEFGIAEVAGDRLCFINLTREFIIGKVPLPFGPENVVLEILETVDPDDEVVAGVAALVEAGYKIALDDYVHGSGHERLLPLASYLKLDMLDSDVDRFDEVAAVCREYPGIQIVAERLETADHIALADRYGFELRQGYALSRPRVMTATSLSPSRLVRLQLVPAIGAADMDRVISTIVSDPALALRVLRASNSAAAGAAYKVSSVRQAVVLLGLTQIRQWAMIMALGDAVEATDEQLTTALLRARFCESLAEGMHASPDAAFTAGLISGVAEVLSLTPAMLADRLPLADDVAGALIDGTGALGDVLRTVDAFSRGDLESVAPAAHGTDLVRAYVDGWRWSARMVAATKVPA